MFKKKEPPPPPPPPPQEAPALREIPIEQQTTQQLVDTCVRTHKDTTNVANRALRVVEETKEIQAQTLKQLDKQGEQQDKLSSQLRDMHEELTYAERLLSYMRRCCCCFVCDSCTGADPEAQKKKEWRRRVDAGINAGKADKTLALNEAKTTSQSRADGEGGGAGGGQGGPSDGSPAKPRLRDPDIRFDNAHRAQEMQLHDETRKQNVALDQIHLGLDHLLEGAKLMNEEVSRQNKNLDHLDSKVQVSKDRIVDMNKNSQLKNLARGQPKASGSDSFAPSKNALAVSAIKKSAGL